MSSKSGCKDVGLENLRGKSSIHYSQDKAVIDTKLRFDSWDMLKLIFLRVVSNFKPIIYFYKTGQ